MLARQIGAYQQLGSKFEGERFVSEVRLFRAGRDVEVALKNQLIPHIRVSHPLARTTNMPKTKKLTTIENDLNVISGYFGVRGS
jgi:hypothetical protein